MKYLSFCILVFGELLAICTGQCSKEWEPLCAIRGSNSGSGELVFFPSECALQFYNMQFPKRRMKLAMKGKCTHDKFLPNGKDVITNTPVEHRSSDKLTF